MSPIFAQVSGKLISLPMGINIRRSTSKRNEGRP
jgi:hypothetical protein